MTITPPLIPDLCPRTPGFLLYTYVQKPHPPPPAVDNILRLYLGYASIINNLDKHICSILSTRPPDLRAGLQRKGRLCGAARVSCGLNMQTSVQQFIRQDHVRRTEGSTLAVSRTQRPHDWGASQIMEAPFTGLC